MLEKRNYTFELRAQPVDKKAVGYAAMFNSDSHDLGGFIERIEPGAFAATLQSARAGDHNIYALWAHDTSQPLGSTRSGKLTLAEDETGLAFELSTARFNAQQLDALADGELQMSFAFGVRAQEWRELDDGMVLRILKEVEISEVSFVINPAYPDTSAALRSLGEWKAKEEAPKFNPTKLIRKSLEALSRRRLG